MMHSAARLDESDRGVYAQLSHHDMGQNLIGLAPDEIMPVTTATPMIEVVAPSTLEEGFTFEAQLPHNQKTFVVTVPKGGVQEGQKFMAPLPQSQPLSQFGIIRKMIIPVGSWRDGMWDIFRHGICHYSVLNSIFCIPIAAAQVMTRLRLSWNGQPTIGNVGAQATSAFWIIFAFVAFYWIVRSILTYYYWNAVGHLAAATTSSYSSNGDDRWSPYDGRSSYGKSYHAPSLESQIKAEKAVIAASWALRVWWWLYMAFTIYLLRNVRRYVRSKYAIPENESCPTGCEDLICACACPCLTAAQMMRHTTEYETYRSSFCSETGLPSHVPAIL